MHLTPLYISRYKNLRDFSLGFDGSSFIDVFVSNNGTGKFGRMDQEDMING